MQRTALTNFPYLSLKCSVVFAYLNFNLLSHNFLENSRDTILNGTCSGGIGEIFNLVSFFDLQYVSFSMGCYIATSQQKDY